MGKRSLRSWKMGMQGGDRAGRGFWQNRSVFCGEELVEKKIKCWVLDEFSIPQTNQIFQPEERVCCSLETFQNAEYAVNVKSF